MLPHRLIIRNSMTLIPAGLTASSPPPETGAAMCTTSISASITSWFRTLRYRFNLIDIGERAGSGIPNIFRVWSDQNWTTPKITEQLEPERTILSLAFEKASDKKQAIKASNSTIYSRQKQSVIEYLTREIQADCKTIADLLEISSPRARAVLTKMVKEEIIITEGGNRNRTYKLKS